ncbi:MAG: DUF1801 domain-containing protein [Proteobacteria bacterium]|nr:DUF1801 domain-containing protein [Pseudomonadota bacterium]
MSPAANKSAKATSKSASGFSADEKAAMRDRVRELKAEKNKADGEAALLAKVASLPEPDRSMATRLHAIVKAAAPQLAAKTWYGMPAYADAEGKVVCFFQPASRFGARYATFGFNDTAKLDDGAMWATAFALQTLSTAEEKKIAALVKRAVG